MSATINQSYSDAIRQIHTWLVLELTLVHKAYKLAPFQELVTGPYLWLMAANARCSLRWSMAGMTEAMLDVPPHKKNNVVSLKI
jgi:hypothetical protein